MRKMKVPVGAHIANAAQKLIEESHRSEEQVQMEFNGITLVADKDSTLDSIVEEYFTKSEASREKRADPPQSEALQQ